MTTECTKEFDIRYDRRVSHEFLSNFLPGGVAERLNVIAHKAAFPLDLQMRKSPKTGAEHASLYVGLTDVLNVSWGRRSQKFRLRAHKTWANQRNGYDRLWGLPAGLSMDELRSQWTAVELYLERVIPKAVKGHGTTEGAIQALVSTRMDTELGVIMLDREVTPSFKDTEYRQETVSRLAKEVLAAARSAGLKATVPKSLGTECDLLAIDGKGRLLAVEVKPIDVGSITWVPAQAAMYAKVLQEWIDVDGSTALEPCRPRDVIAGMVSQRQELGHSQGLSVSMPKDLKVTPVVILQRGARDAQKQLMLATRAAVDEANLGLPSIEIYEISITGEMTRID